jgi:hypothetical protein
VELAGDIFRFTEVAFHEDKVIIEAQQKVIGLDPARQMLSLLMDSGPNLFNRTDMDLAVTIAQHRPRVGRRLGVYAARKPPSAQSTCPTT